MSDAAQAAFTQLLSPALRDKTGLLCAELMPREALLCQPRTPGLLRDHACREGGREGQGSGSDRQGEIDRKIEILREA